MNKAAKQALVGRERVPGQPDRGRFTETEVTALVGKTWRNFDALAPSITWEPTLGARIYVVLSALTVSFYSALIREGTGREHATGLVADAKWVVYRRMGAVSRILAAMTAKSPSDRLRASVELFLRFPFNPPSYSRRDLFVDSATAFEITRCPVADYFTSRGLPDLCVATWCNQDYALAEMWGGRLLRKGTIAGGGDSCDFAFVPVVLTGGSGRGRA